MKYMITIGNTLLAAGSSPYKHEISAPVLTRSIPMSQPVFDLPQVIVIPTDTGAQIEVQPTPWSTPTDS